MELEKIDIVTDKTASSKCDEGFLRVRRLVLRNSYGDGTQSEPYNCDIVERRQIDAVSIALYEKVKVEGQTRVSVLLRKGIRAPVYLRKDLDDKQRPEPLYTKIYELVAGVLEDGDLGYEGVDHRAVEEAREEVGLEIGREAVGSLGASFFPSPGITPEKVYLAACEGKIEVRGEALGDGSVMEEGATAEILDLREAIAMCRTGEIQDAKTEIGLLRLADYLGYIPQLDCFMEDLPEELRARYLDLGVREKGYC
jgi:ADP-ribose pyrophosphatase